MQEKITIHCKTQEEWDDVVNTTWTNNLNTRHNFYRKFNTKDYDGNMINCISVFNRKFD